MDKEGCLIRTKPRKHIENLDSIPFTAYDLIPDISAYNPPPHDYKNLPVGFVITSRGCPYQCTFCDRNVFGSTLRQRSAENVAQEIIILYRKFGVREINFCDDTFTINHERIYKIFNILKQNNISITWNCRSRINTVDEEAIKMMAKLGCWQISFGIESGSPEILKIIKKNIDLDYARKVLKWCKREKMETSGFFMVGHPGETIETIDKTIAFATSVPMTSMITSINTPIPGSDQYKVLDKWGTVASTDWSQYNYWRPVFIPHGLDEKTLMKKHKEFYRRFYFRPSVAFSLLFRGGGRGLLRRIISMIKALPYVFQKS
jgi:radical SAM superfamily enzyme YgiQ (UPF0313 family)